MAIGTPVERYAVSVLVNNNTQNISPATTVAAGTRAILLSSVSTFPISTVTDSVGNAWTVHYAHTFADTNTHSVASCQVVTPITSGDTITITWTGSGNFFRLNWVLEVSGLAISSAFDQQAFAASVGTSGAYSVGPTGTLAQADELALSMSTYSGDALLSSMPGWTSSGTRLQSAGEVWYDIVAVADPITASGTLNRADRTWDGSVVTFKGFVAPSDVNLAPVIYGRGAA
jgi:hypothetical protein